MSCGGQSLGEALSYRMAEAGYDIAVADINGENAERTAEHAAGQYGVKSLWIQADFTKEADVEKMIGRITEEFNKIDVMVFSRPFGVLAVDVCARDFISRLCHAVGQRFSETLAAAAYQCHFSFIHLHIAPAPYENLLT